MAEVNNNVRKSVGSGEIGVFVNSNVSHHSIAIEAADANTFTLTSKVQGLTVPVAFESNTIDNNARATFVLAGTESFIITPSDLTKPYVISVHSF